MRRTPEQRQKQRAQFAGLSPLQKLEHIWLYYKAPILLTLIAAVILVSSVSHFLRKKEPLLYMAYLNTAVGSELETHLTADYLTQAGADPDRTELLLYRDLYLSDAPAAMDHEYAYASRLKLMAAINARQLDLVLMNREAYDFCSRNGYLLDLSEQLRDHPLLTTNQVILEDNAAAYDLGQAEEYIAVTELSANALELTTLPHFARAGFSGPVYLGVIANTPRTEQCSMYLQYLLSSDTCP